MNMLSTFYSMDCSCDAALQWIQNRLFQAGLRAMQTFDLHATRARHSPVDCPCPNHGTNACDCQMLVLLVYGKEGQPVTLILHGNEGQTWLSIAENPRQTADTDLLAQILQALNVLDSTAQNGKQSL